MGEPVRDAEDEAPHVVVAVRLRPTDSEKVLEPRGNQLVFSYKGEEHRYCFDHVLDDKADQAAVFDLLGKPQLDKAFDGYNSTIFAYGQTGSGKTFTMLNVQGGEEELGLIPRISRYLFLRTADASSKTSRFLVQCSFLEIYNEVIYDLLAPRGDKGKGLEVREQKGLGVYVKDLTEEVVANTQHLDRLIAEGFAQRTTAATAMNDASSRSHCVFTICLHYQDTEDNSRNTISKLNLVDLAGSERNDSEVRKQLKEGANINKSLSALGNVINALSSASSSRRRAFVPYRDSKLTRVLQESLGGNAFCTMIATTCPSEGNSEETWHTLQYAKRAKTIRVAATRNEETKQRQQMEKEVEELRKSAEGREELEAQHRAEIEALEDFMKQTWEDKQRLTREHEEQRDLARLEVQRAMEQRKAEQQRRLEALEKLGDLHVTLQSWVASQGETGSRWPEHLASVLRCPQQLQSQLKTVRLYRDGAVSDVELLKRDLDATSQLLLSQAQAKLQIMAKELAAAEQAEVSYKSQLCTLSAEIAVTLQEGKEQEVEGLELLQLVQLQLREHYAATSGQFLQEVAQLNFSLTQLGQRLRDLAEGADLPDLELEVAPDVLPLALGLASREVPDTQISASSHSHLASCARLQRCELAGAWCPATGKEEFLEVDLQEPMTVVGIAMQGRVPCSGLWQQTHGLLQLALGSGEAPWVDRTFVRPPVRCVHEVAVALIQQRCFGEWREVPEAAKDFGAMTKESKLDFLSRLIQESSVKKLSAKPSGLDVEGLSDSEEEVEPLQLTAQDILAGRNCTETNRMLQLMACRALGLGEAPHWTRRWRLQYQGPAGWQWYAPGQSDEAVDLEGNSDAQKVHFVQLEPIQTSRLRIYPVSWQLWPALRLEVFVLPRDAKLHAAPIFQKLQAHVGLALQGLDTLRRHIEAGMREDQLAKEQQAQEQGQLQSQLNEALARAASAEAALLQLRAENQRLQQLADTREAEAEAETRAEGQSLREECQRLRAAVEDFQEQLAVVWDERDVARKHEEELFYVISRKDEELLQVHKVLAELTQQAKERELADEAAELLGSEMAGYSEQIQELSDRCKQLEEENLDLRAERDRVNRKREKLSEQKHELQERLRLSETARQAARERCEQILQKVKQRDDPDALEDLRKSMEEFGPETSAPKPKLQRSRTVGAIAGTGAAAAEALVKADESASCGLAVLPVFGMPVSAGEASRDGSTPNTGRSRRSTHSVQPAEALPGFGDAGGRSSKRPTSSRSSKSVKGK